MNKVERLEHVRKVSQLSKADFAQLMDCSPTNYSNIMSGRNDLRLSHVELLWKKIGVNPLWVITGEGDMFLNTGQKSGDSATYIIPEAGLSHASDEGEKDAKKYELMRGIIDELGIGIPVIKGEFAYAVLERICTQYIGSPRGASLAAVDYAALSASYVAALQTAYSFLGASLVMEGGTMVLKFEGQHYTFSGRGPNEQ